MLVTIGTPHSGHFAVEYVMSLCRTLLDRAFDYEVLHYEGCYVHSLRNMLMADAHGDFLLFIDSDMAWTTEDIQRLVRMDEGISGGLYFKRRRPYGSVVYEHDGRTFKQMKAIPERAFKCAGIGTGFMLIRRDVINRFKDPELVADWGFPFDPIKAIIPGEASSYYSGEDMSFCTKAGHLEIPIWCDPETIVGHVGTQVVKAVL